MYGDGGLSDVIAPDADAEFPKMKEFVSLDAYSTYKNHEHNHNQSQSHVQSHIQNQHQQSDIGRHTESSLTRFRSAPSSLFADLLDDDFLAPFVDASSNHEFRQHHQQQQQQQQQLQQQQQQQQQQRMLSNGNGIYDHANHNNLESSSRFRSMDSTSSNLIRQSSSPAGFFSSLKSESGINGAKTISSNRMRNNISFSPGPSSSSMFLPQIPENGNQISDSTFKSLKRTRDGDAITLERQDALSGHYTPTLVHHLSLPKTSSEMAVAERILRFDRDLVPTNNRAKRGCATHPRSIAERVRRTRISERMKKLQELFPNLDKQTSTADMLDMAVQYIKDLQKDLQTLKDARSKCACSSKQ